MFSNIDAHLSRIRTTIRDCFSNSPFSELLDDPTALLSNQGKMLRSRFGLHLGLANETDPDRLVRTCAATEMLHTASLLHDDVIDNGLLRRGVPAFWKQHSTPGAILLGDLLMFYAMQVLVPLQDQSLSEELIRLAGEVGETEVQQEILQRGIPQTWQECVKTARSKTGPLFAFTGYAAGNHDPHRSVVLRECGYLIGTAYQLADDLLDAFGSSEQADKSLQRDHLRNKHTSACVFQTAEVNPIQYIQRLLSQALEQLADFPSLHLACTNYLQHDISPVINEFTRRFNQLPPAEI